MQPERVSSFAIEHGGSIVGFSAFDDGLSRMGTEEARAVVVRVTPGSERAVLAHAARRLAARGFSVVATSPSAATPAWVEAASKLGTSVDSMEPAVIAENISVAARSRPTVLLLPLAPKGSWDREVTQEVLQTPFGPAVVLVTTLPDDSLDLKSALRYECIATLSTAEVKRWFDVAAESLVRSVEELRLPELEDRFAPAAVDESAALDERAARLLHALWLIDTGMQRSELGRFAEELLGPHGAETLESLIATRHLDVDHGWISAPTHITHTEISPEEIARVANALEVANATHPLSFIRAAELHLQSGNRERADAAQAKAMTLVRHPPLRREMLARWLKAIESLPDDVRVALYRKAAERALDAGDAVEATQLADLASRLLPNDVGTIVLFGKALTASGDLTAARVALERARSIAGSDASAMAIAVEIAEVALRSGNLDEAVRESTPPAAALPPSTTTLRARNILGKVLLAQSQWEQADRHFAQDVLLASSLGENGAELRARLNRGVALLSRGLLDEAKSVLEAVERDGTRLGIPTSCAYASLNLAVIATIRHNYGPALAFTERALEHMVQAGDRITMAGILANLAELRFKLGLYEHAEHAIAFGRRTLGPGMPSDLSACFSVVSARLSLSRGDTSEARREIERALSDSEAARSRVKTTSEAYRVATRIALEDGDMSRAKDALACAKERITTDEARGETALLEAYVARAAGDSYQARAEEALLLARAAGEEELLREVHMLLFDRHRAEQEQELSRAQLVHAESLRDKVAATLQGEVRTAYLARQDVALLDRLRQEIADSDADPVTAPNSLVEPQSVRKIRTTPTTREMVGDDPQIRALQIAIRKVATSDSTVLIHGESGTGKELVAEAIHRSSPRVAGPMISVNCAALVETLLLSELFGHEKGSFTGAGGRRRGRFEMADGGTLFLDEIGDISPRTQVALLRVLQERTFERVGGSQPVRVNVRIVCATHRDLKSMVERGSFREDLYYRLRGVALEVPPLRSRLGDLPAICENLLARIASEQGSLKRTLSPAAADLLSRYRWPGNIRELENALRVAALFADSTILSAKDFVDNVEELRAVSPRTTPPPFAPVTLPELSEEVGEDGLAPVPAQESDATSIVYACMKSGTTTLSDIKRQIERDCIARALAETKGNITRAAALLGMKRPRLSQLVKQYGLGAVMEDT